MHECCGGPGDLAGAVSRRAALTAAGSAVLGAGLLSASTGTAAAQPVAQLPENALITLGVQAGPPPIPNRIGISSALKIGADVYVIDCGLGSLNAFANAGLKFANLRSMFITHLHADHIVDYYSFFLSGGAAARPGRAAVPIYGPGPAGGLPPSEVGDPDPPTVAPGNPTPGLAATTAALQQAFAYTSNIFIRDNGVADIAALMDVVEIAVPPGPSYPDRSPKMDPFPVMSDENVTVTATLVPHYDVYPAFAFRFDIHRPAVSVTFSGDTTVSENLVTLARGTDILVSGLVLLAVFVPAAFVPGIPGVFFRQFAVAIATAAAVSLLVSLTLSPALSAMLLKPHEPDHEKKSGGILAPLNWVASKFNQGFDWLSDRYGRVTGRLVRMSTIMLVVYAALLGLTGWRMTATPTGSGSAKPAGGSSAPAGGSAPAGSGNPPAGSGSGTGPTPDWMK